MDNKFDTYTLRTEVTDGITRYFVCFKDGQGVFREIEVAPPVYSAFCQFVKVERNLRRSDERHIEQSDLSDELLSKRAVHPQKSIEDTIADTEWANALQSAIAELPETQRRRFVLYYYSELTYKQIAEMEGCSHVAVMHSLEKAKAAIEKRIKNLK
ncbi:MAG TPA: sigma-70 family RNA polymerase sigma factor [Clostridiales bacterium]|nr:sigma-70 family RNA polymerase sigma factor [Clostridiales bacterium]